MVAASVIKRVDDRRLERAAEGLTSGAYEVALSYREEQEIRGVVRKKIGKAYGGGFAWLPYSVTITDTLTACSCPDALYRGVPCKHCVALALYVIGHPGERPSEGERKPDLSLRKVRTEAEREQVRRDIEERYGKAA